MQRDPVAEGGARPNVAWSPRSGAKPNVMAHLRISCPRCQRGNLRIRPEHLGRKVECKHCGHFFVARTADSPSSIPPRSEPGASEQEAAPAVGIADERVTALEAELLRIQAQCADQAALSGTLTRQMQEELARSQDRERELQGHLGQAQAELRSLSEAWAQRSEAELLARQSELEARSAAAARTDQFAKELEVLRAECDRLNAEQQAGMGREERLRHEHRERERSFSESTATYETARATIAGQLEEAHARWESERQAIEQAWEERLRTHVRDGEQQLVEAQARAMTVQQETRQQHDDDRRRFDQELDSLREETERLRNQLQARSQECDELAGRAETLVGERAVMLEQAKALRQETDRIAADRDEAEATFREAERRARAENDGLRQALEIARDQADLPARDAEAAAWADLERRFAEAQDRLRTETQRADQIEADYQAVCERLAGLHRSAARDPSESSDPAPTWANAEVAMRHISAATLRLDELNEQLDRSRAANERLRSLLKVFGLVPKRAS